MLENKVSFEQFMWEKDLDQESFITALMRKTTKL